MKKLTPTNKVVDVINGVTDYVKGGELFKDSVVGSVMVESESDLENLTQYEAGSIAYTAGYGNVWQKDADGEWQSII